jgi:hypothetical protein
MMFQALQQHSQQLAQLLQLKKLNQLLQQQVRHPQLLFLLSLLPPGSSPDPHLEHSDLLI